MLNSKSEALNQVFNSLYLEAERLSDKYYRDKEETMGGSKEKPCEKDVLKDFIIQAMKTFVQES